VDHVQRAKNLAKGSGKLAAGVVGGAVAGAVAVGVGAVVKPFLLMSEVEADVPIGYLQQVVAIITLGPFVGAYIGASYSRLTSGILRSGVRDLKSTVLGVRHTRESQIKAELPRANPKGDVAVLSESKASNALSKGETVYGETGDGKHAIGTVQTVFSKGLVEVKWKTVDGEPTDHLKVWPESQLCSETQCYNGFKKGQVVYTKTAEGKDRVGTVQTLFTKNFVEVNWKTENGVPTTGRNVLPATQICDEIACYDKLKKGEKVYAKLEAGDAIGKVENVFTNGLVNVKWNTLNGKAWNGENAPLVAKDKLTSEVRQQKGKEKALKSTVIHRNNELPLYTGKEKALKSTVIHRNNKLPLYTPPSAEFKAQMKEREKTEKTDKIEKEQLVRPEVAKVANIKPEEGQNTTNTVRAVNQQMYQLNNLVVPKNPLPDPDGQQSSKISDSQRKIVPEEVDEAETSPVRVKNKKSTAAIAE